MKYILQAFVVAASLCSIPSAALAQDTSVGDKAVEITVEHDLSAAQMKKLAGKHYWDKDVKPVLAPFLEKLLGPKWEAFDTAYHKTTPMVYESGILYGSGWWGNERSAFEFDVMGTVRAAFKNDDGCTDYGMVHAGYICSTL